MAAPSSKFMQRRSSFSETFGIQHSDTLSVVLFAISLATLSCEAHHRPPRPMMRTARFLQRSCVYTAAFKPSICAVGRRLLSTAPTDTLSSSSDMEEATTAFQMGDPLTTKVLSEHKRLEALFRQYEQLPDTASSQQRLKLGWEMIRQISMHAATEEMVLYPAVAKHMGDAAGDRLVEETQAVKEVLAELNDVKDAQDPRVLELVQKTISMTRNHIKDEESSFLPDLTKSVEPAELQQLARQFEAARGAAPTRPHPQAPNKPPLNLFANAAAVPLDMARDALRFGPGNLSTDVGDQKV